MFTIMRRRGQGWLACCLLLLLPTLAWAGAGDGIVGDWLVASGDAVIRIARKGDDYEGHIVWQLHDTYGPEDGPDLDGKPVTDRHNLDPANRSRPLNGLRLIWDLAYDPEQQFWNGGRVYDADNGHTFRCQMWLLDPNHIKLRGYFGISLIGGTSVWSRVNKIPPDLPAAATGPQ